MKKRQKLMNAFPMPIRGAKLHIRNMRCRACHQKIRATKERIKSLETEQTREETEYDTDGLGFDVVENKEIARLQIIYPGGGRVDNETYKRLRENGFVFSRTNGAFQRQLNENSRYAVRRFIQSQRNIVEQMSTKKETEAEM